MDNRTSVAQYLAVLGGSANPALMQNTSKNDKAALPDFRNMLFMQFDQFKNEVKNKEAQNADKTSQTPQFSRDYSGKTSSMNIWQVISTNASSANNALVLQLQSQGVAAHDIDTITKALDQSDLITILRDPSLKSELENAINQMISVTSANGQDAINIPTLSDILQALKDADKNIEDLITVNIAEMNMEEFKEWKKQAFSDLAAFFQNPKTKVGANGEVIKILQGPAFLHDTNNGESVDVIIDIIQNNNRLTPTELAIHMAGNAMTDAHTNMPLTTGSFVPLPLENMGSLSPDIKDALQNLRLTRDPQTGQFAFVAKDGVQNNPSPMTGAGTIQQASQNGTMFSPLLTPADFNALALGGDGSYGTDFDALIPQFEASFKTTSQSANPLVTQQHAAQSHPTSQMVAISLTKMATGKGTESDTQRYRLQLDPPEMGRVNVELEFEAGHKVRAMIMAEKPETLSLLQRDSHALLKALQDAGFDAVSQDNLNFNLSQGQNDTAGHDHGQDRQNGQNALLSPDGENEVMITETQMSTVIDPVTGLKHVNMVV